MSKPFFSIVIPVFNSKEYIIDALDSVARQTFLNYELIIVNDGSNDGTQEVIESYFKSKHITQGRIINHTEHKGIAFSRNIGISVANADFIAFLDADDIWDKDKLRKVNKVIVNNSNFDLICHNEYFYIADTPKIELRYKPSTNNIFEFLLFETNCISTSATTVRKNKLFEVGLFSEALPMAEDYDMWLKLAPISTFYFLEEFLGEFHLRDNSATSDIDLLTNCVMKVIHNHFNLYSKRKQWPNRVKFQQRKANVLLESSRNAYYRKKWRCCFKYCWKYLYTSLFLDFNEFSCRSLNYEYKSS